MKLAPPYACGMATSLGDTGDSGDSLGQPGTPAWIPVTVSPCTRSVVGTSGDKAYSRGVCVGVLQLVPHCPRSVPSGETGTAPTRRGVPGCPHCPRPEDAVLIEVVRSRAQGPGTRLSTSPRSHYAAWLLSLLIGRGCCSTPVCKRNCCLKIPVLPPVSCPCFPSLVAGVLISDQCFCPSRTPKRCGNYEGPGTPRPFCAEVIHWPPRHAALAPMAIAAASRFIGLNP